MRRGSHAARNISHGDYIGATNIDSFRSKDKVRRHDVESGSIVIVNSDFVFFFTFFFQDVR